MWLGGSVYALRQWWCALWIINMLKGNAHCLFRLINKPEMVHPFRWLWEKTSDNVQISHCFFYFRNWFTQIWSCERWKIPSWASQDFWLCSKDSIFKGIKKYSIICCHQLLCPRKQYIIYDRKRERFLTMIFKDPAHKNPDIFIPLSTNLKKNVIPLSTNLKKVWEPLHVADLL